MSIFPKEYYFLASSFAPLRMGHKAPMAFSDLNQILEANLLQEDFEDFCRIRRFYDIQNLQSLWMQEALSGFGNYTKDQLEQCIKDEEGLADWILSFISKYESKKERLSHFSELFFLYFKNEIPKSKGLLREYLCFERKWRLVMTSFRAKALGRSIVHELQYEDSNDFFVAQIIALKDANIYEPPAGYEPLKPIFETYGKEPMELYRHLEQYRFEKIREMSEAELFTFDGIIAYTVELICILTLQDLEKKQSEGAQLVHQMLEGIK